MHLVDDWRRCHKWWSIRLVALAGVLQGAVLWATSTGLAQYVHPWLLTGMSDAAMACTVLAGVARVIQQKDGDNEPDKPVQP